MDKHSDGWKPHTINWTSQNITKFLMLPDAVTNFRNRTSSGEGYMVSDANEKRIIVIAVIMAFTLIGNMTLILVLMCKRSRRTRRVSILLINLAFGDLAVALFVNSTEILFLAFGDWALGPVLCKVSVYVQMICLSSATNLLTTMSIDRYQVIVKPMQTLASRPWIWLKIAVAWTMSLIFPIPQLFIFVQYNDGLKYDGMPRRNCGSRGYTASWQRKVYFTYTTAYILVVPMAIMLYCYVKIIKVVWIRATNETRKQSSCGILPSNSNSPSFRISEDGSNPGSPRMSVRRGLVSAAKRRVLIMTLSVVISFLLCQVPYFCVNHIRIYSDYKTKLEGAKIVSEFMVMVHSTLNPILYGLFTLREYHLKYLIAFLAGSRHSVPVKGMRFKQYSGERRKLFNKGRSSFVSIDKDGRTSTVLVGVGYDSNSHTDLFGACNPAAHGVLTEEFNSPPVVPEETSSTASIFKYLLRCRTVPQFVRTREKKQQQDSGTILFTSCEAIHLSQRHARASKEME